jgi:predicted kinase
MTQDEIIEMAKQAGFEEHQAKFDTRFEPFAKLVAQHEREACARVCELMWHEWLDSPEENEPNKPDAEDCYRAIRERGQA